jgi:hypothetical protein
MIAGQAPPIQMPAGVQVPGMPPGMQPGGFPQPGMQPGGFPPPGMQPGGFPPPGAPGAPGPNKTVALQPSEGVVSIARTGGQPLQPASGMQQGATPLFWFMSLLIGVALGAIAYVIVLQVM